MPKQSLADVRSLLVLAAGTIAEARRRGRRSALVWTAITGVLLLGILAAVPTAVGLHAGDEWSGLEWAWYLALSLTAIPVVWAALVGSAVWLDPRGRLTLSLWAVTALTTAAAAAALIQTDASVGRALALAVSAATALSLAVWFLGRASMAIVRNQYEPGSARNPEALIVWWLAEALSTIEERPTAIADEGAPLPLGDRVNVCTRPLEQAARVIERGLAEPLRPGDPSTQAWLKTLLDRIAAGVRSYKRDVIAATLDSRETLLTELGEALVHVAAGEWGLMKQAEPPTAQKGPMRSRMFSLATSLLWAAIPVAAFVVLQQTDWRLEGAVEGWAAVGVILWAIVSVLAAFDPRFGEKIDAMGNVAEMLPKGKP